MPNTISIKKTNTNNAPTSLQFGELAINVNNVLFIGNNVNLPKILCSPNVLNITSAAALDFNASTIMGNATVSGFTVTLPDLTSLNNIYDGFHFFFRNNGNTANNFLTINTFNSSQYIGAPTAITASLDRHQYASYVGCVATMCWERVS